MGKLKWINFLGELCEKEFDNIQDAKIYCDFIGIIDEYNHPVFITEIEQPIKETK